MSWFPGPLQRSLQDVWRDAVWTLRRAWLRNPAWPERVDSLLFVCQANLCRSPFAARLAERRLRDAGIPAVRCTSAGFRVHPMAAPPPDAIAVACRYGVRIEDHRAVRVTDDLIRSHDVVFVMEPGQLAQLRRRWPGERARFFLLSRFASTDTTMGAHAREHLPDPFGRGEEAFVGTYTRISRAIDHVVTALVARSRPAAGRP